MEPTLPLSFEQQVIDRLERLEQHITSMREDNARRFAELELHDRECYGNGQPGWKAQHERRINQLLSERSEHHGMGRVAGWVWGSALTVLTLIAEFLIHRK